MFERPSEKEVRIDGGPVGESTVLLGALDPLMGVSICFSAGMVRFYVVSDKVRCAGSRHRWITPVEHFAFRHPNTVMRTSERLVGSFVGQ